MKSSVRASSPVKRSFTSGDEIDLPKRKRKQSEAIPYEIVVLDMLVDILLSPERRYINKFATTITSKVHLTHPVLTLVVSSPSFVFQSRSHCSRC
jgi:hypothetical protein